MDVVEALLTALEAQRRLVTGVTPADLHRATRCPAWSLSELMNHSVGVTLKFAEFASGATDHPRTPEGDLIGDRLDVALRSTVDTARTAWSSADRSWLCHLPFGTFPADIAAGINLVDVLAHGWDVGVVGVRSTPALPPCGPSVSRWPVDTGAVTRILGTSPVRSRSIPPSPPDSGSSVRWAGSRARPARGHPTRPVSLARWRSMKASPSGSGR